MESRLLLSKVVPCKYTEVLWHSDTRSNRLPYIFSKITRVSILKSLTTPVIITLKLKLFSNQSRRNKQKNKKTHARIGACVMSRYYLKCRSKNKIEREEGQNGKTCKATHHRMESWLFLSKVVLCNHTEVLWYSNTRSNRLPYFFSKITRVYILMSLTTSVMITLKLKLFSFFCIQKIIYYMFRLLHALLYVCKFEAEKRGNTAVDCSFRSILDSSNTRSTVRLQVSNWKKAKQDSGLRFSVNFRFI